MDKYWTIFSKEAIIRSFLVIHSSSEDQAIFGAVFIIFSSNVARGNIQKHQINFESRLSVKKMLRKNEQKNSAKQKLAKKRKILQIR